MSKPLAYIGCAGWSVPSEYRAQFPQAGTHLERYAARFPAAEINSSFYRSHQLKTYARWAASVPEHFRFAVKLPRQITHQQRLLDAGPALDQFAGEVSELGEKLGPVLVQLPPSLGFETTIAQDFFAVMREYLTGPVACEPRHQSWFKPEPDRVLQEFQVARVAADPAPVAGAELPGGWSDLAYYRLHGSPRMYYSAYSPDFLSAMAKTFKVNAERNIPTWCIFDNTASGAATNDAMSLLQQV